VAQRNRVLALLAMAELLGMSVWFSASALAPQLARAWSLTPAQTGWLTGTVQLGFVSGTAVAALLNLADIVPLRISGCSRRAGSARHWSRGSARGSSWRACTRRR
jgi:hypothetical protein